MTVAVPASPTGLNTVTALATGITLNWTAPSGAVIGYNVYRGTSPGGENYSSPLNGGTPVTATTYSDTTVAAGTTYYYTVEAVNIAGSSAASNQAVIVDGAVLNTASNPLPAGAAVTVTDGGQINLGGGTAAVASLALVSGSVVNGALQVGGGVQVESGTISAAMSGGGGLVKSTSGVATLSAGNTLSGGTTVSAGRLIVTSPAALPNGSSLTIGNAAAFGRNCRGGERAGVGCRRSATPKRLGGRNSPEEGDGLEDTRSIPPLPVRASRATRSVQRALAWLAVVESPWPWTDWDRQTGPSVEALDAAFARCSF